MARLSIAFGVLAGLLELTANRLLANAPASPEALTDRVQWLQALMFAASVLLIFALPVTATAVVVAVSRLVYSLSRRTSPPDAPTESNPPRLLPGKTVLCGPDPSGSPDESGRMGSRAAWVANWRLPESRTRGGVGICVSGGGIRSAVFTLGALQALQEVDRLREARYLVAVSGGGYAAGAMRLALQPSVPVKPAGWLCRMLSRLGSNVSAGGSSESLATPQTVFAMGSPEFDHVRRHSKYLADGAGQWVTALAVVLRGFLVAQLMLLLAVMLVGRGIGEVYSAAPTALQEALLHPSRLPLGVRWAVAVPLLAALVCWMLGVVFENWPRTACVRRLLRPTATVLAYAGLVMVLFGLLVPVLLWGSTKVPGPPGDTGVQQAATGAATVLTAGYLAAVAGIFMTVGRFAGSVMGWVRRNRAALAVVPTVLLQWTLILLGVAVLIAAHLLVFARVILGTTKGTNEWPGPVGGWHFWLIALAFVFLALLVDQTRWSLHPFYKRRLATAFAVRRVRRNGETGSEQYRPEEVTSLSSTCRPWTEDDPFPQVIFLTAANVSGQRVTPPGRKVLPYTLSGDWIGSPRLGWIDAEALENAVRHPLRLDLTTQAAMAISGAAFASAMGAAATPFSLLFALTNARLGTWLPNPLFLYKHPPAPDVHEADAADAPGSAQAPTVPSHWRYPRLPSWRRLHFLVREIFGIYPWNAQMLLVTDGGHYENLGLVEMLRHAPNVVYCFDASGGATLPASALGPAIRLAREELGIEITFDDPPHDPEGATPGSATAASKDQPNDPLAARLASSDVVIATITYPDCRPPTAPAHGKLFLGRAGLTRTTPWDVRAYAVRHPRFPNDSTGDQWFDQEQFDAYHALGRHIGRSVLTAAQASGAQSSSAGIPSPAASSGVPKQPKASGNHPGGEVVTP
ncbi:Patatin-like phospholipase [Micromonospora rhizosphaerae]|uniref:Patatin-like phospholipase n=2 Tax=Micromonospora rhizosphaerae TaxID=568872 RepID=A0A1C6SZE1_9ACTN|nr:Patatin-like phospholipase [Micromonospora rhizosphaerae]